MQKTNNEHGQRRLHQSQFPGRVVKSRAIDLNEGLDFPMMSTDPVDPPDNSAIMWLDSIGDLKIKINVNGEVKTGTLADFSAL